MSTVLITGAATASAYAELDPLVGTLASGFAALNPPGTDASPEAVGREVAKLLDLPFGGRPHRVLVDYQALGLEQVLDVQEQVTAEVLGKMGLSALLAAV